MVKILSGASIKKIIFFAITLVLFGRLVAFPSDLPWYEKFQMFHVPANTWPGGDSRSIQITAYCKSLAESDAAVSSCAKTATIIKSVYGDAEVPPFNYPNLWVSIYGLFSDFSEVFFLNFWKLNAGLLVLTICVLAFIFEWNMLPVFLFSPITLLCVERANIDAIVFFLTFMPIIIFRQSAVLQSFFLGLAAGAKIFPIFGLLSFVKFRPLRFEGGGSGFLCLFYS